MSVDWFDCDVCRESICDCEDYVSCDCGRNWCSDECAEVDDYKEQHCKLGYDTDDNECEESCYDCDNNVGRSCKYCREEDYEDEILLNYGLQLLGMNRENLIKRYKEYNGGKR
jgi:hypothetical protein